jgi:hypothetical protein
LCEWSCSWSITPFADRVKELTTDIASMAWTTMYCTGPIEVLKHG